jgi:hypothetical protein
MAFRNSQPDRGRAARERCPALARRQETTVTSKRFAAVVGVLAAACAAGAVADEQTPAPVAPVAVPAAAPATPPTEAPPGLAALGAGKALSADALGEQRATAKLEVDKITINAPTQNGVVAGNAAINTTNGANTIGGAAFAGASGLVSSIQNTGNNVLIQNSTIVNVSVAP